MAVTYGFYNALNHDRLYDAIQMSSIFDGIIRDGIFSTIGTSMTVTAPEDGLYVNVGPGRAWFNHTWTLNDTEYPVEAEEAEVVLDRIDAVILEVNSAAEVRANSIKFLKGTPASEPVKPTLTHNAEVNQYALAYVRIRAGQSTIFQADVENAVGTDETPFVSGLMQQVSIENLILQWEAEFDDHFETWRNVNEAEFEVWSSDMQDEYNRWILNQVNTYQTWFAGIQAEAGDDIDEVMAWFQHMKDQISEDAAIRLQEEIDDLALAAEKGSVVMVHTINQTLHGRTCTITQDGQSRTATFDNTGTAVFESIPYVGQVTITATDGILTAVTYLTIPYFGRYTTNLAFWAATVELSTTSPEFFSLPIKVFKDNVLIETISFSALGSVTYIATSEGVYKFSVTYDDADFDHTIEIDEETTYTVVINDWNATLNMQTSVSELYGRGITISKGGVTVGTTTFNGSGRATYKVHEPGTYHIVTSTAGGDTYQADVVVTEETAYPVDLGLPNGRTALPTDDIQMWLHCAGINDKGYTTLAEVLEDSVTFNALLGDSNACDYMARSTTWALNEGEVPVMTDDTHPSGVVSASTYESGAEPYRAFDGDDSQNSCWAPSSAVNSWLEYEFTSPVKITAFKLIPGYVSSLGRVKNYKIQASNDNFSTVDTLYTGLAENKDYSSSPIIEHFTNNTAYSKYRLFVDDAYSSGSSYIRVNTLQFYTDIDFTHNQLAMSLLGRYDYACDALLSDSTWESAITNSEYWDDVLVDKVPFMTSATTPKGKAAATVNAFDGAPYLVFGGGSWTAANNVSSGIIYYDFEYPILIKKDVTFSYAKGSGNPQTLSCKIVGSNDETNWTDISEAVSVACGTTGNIPVDTDQYYRYIGLSFSGVMYRSGSFRGSLSKLNFYGRHASQNLVPVIHSVPNDTVYYLENGVETTLCTCDSNGVGEVDWSELPQGVMTLYSTTAKDPNNLSNDFSMSIRVTPNKVDAFLIPDEALYWFGWEGGIEDISTANGWTIDSYYTTKASPTHNTNYVAVYANSSKTWCGIGSKNKVIGTVYGIIQGVYTNGSYGGLVATDSKTGSFDTNINSNVMAKYTLTNVNNKYVQCSCAERGSNVYALCAVPTN